ncbi:NtaA/DmoA family FMN-dependent monooxygenase [Patulibacter sp.]|uniref:NtaA/DmoA family FMN-dependent monooxygenase n=1 Tax=Patulibacter sp. TaxID=1912859 RepID=UPI002716450C|nr:NtaA/DmoA family FMN-dependent monooxygenase [Patulibacter sp.]MDO9407434.1 NtaA/DmoA family FMN-dependent monooxygenase [Patulibacter sp.]
MTTEQRPLHFAAFVMNTASHITHGLWRDPRGEQLRFNELDLWVDLAKTLEAGGFDAIFFADVVGLYGDYRGGWDFHAELGLQIPSNDPLVILSALASHTKHLGLAFTAGPIQQPPFNFARQVATLDHASNGRIAWNVVSNLLGWRNFGHEERYGHDDRYALLDEYLDVLYKLWEGSWDDGALLQDRTSGRHADPSRIHKIHHESKHYRVEGPALVAPSPQRTPLIFQAGSSPVGRDFAARHAEAQFIASPDPDNARTLIDDTRRLAEQHGRHRDDLKFFQGLSFVVGSNEAEAREREQELEERVDIDGQIAHFGGSVGIDLGGYDPDTPIDQVHTEGGQSGLTWLRESTGGRTPTLEDIVRLRARGGRVVGTPEQIADRLAAWRDAGVDGINVVNATIPGSYVEFIDHVLPVLRERGLAAATPDPDAPAQTLRARLFGGDLLSDRHPAAIYRGAFSSASDAPAPAPIAAD